MLQFGQITAFSWKGEESARDLYFTLCNKEPDSPAILLRFFEDDSRRAIPLQCFAVVSNSDTEDYDEFVRLDNRDVDEEAGVEGEVQNEVFETVIKDKIKENLYNAIDTYEILRCHQGQSELVPYDWEKTENLVI